MEKTIEQLVIDLESAKERKKDDLKTHNDIIKAIEKEISRLAYKKTTDPL